MKVRDFLEHMSGCNNKAEFIDPRGNTIGFWRDYAGLETWHGLDICDRDVMHIYATGCGEFTIMIDDNMSAEERAEYKEELYGEGPRFEYCMREEI